MPMHIIRTLKFSYTVGGVTMPIYSGDGEIAMNTNSGASVDDDREELMRRARARVAHRGCFEPSMVRITERAVTDRT